jgi:hypothetical protein
MDRHFEFESLMASPSWKTVRTKFPWLAPPEPCELCLVCFFARFFTHADRFEQLGCICVFYCGILCCFQPERKATALVMHQRLVNHQLDQKQSSTQGHAETEQGDLQLVI